LRRILPSSAELAWVKRVHSICGTAISIPPVVVAISWAPEFDSLPFNIVTVFE
jgi:hypothetical protein